MWTYHDLDNARHALEAAIGIVGLAASRLVDDRPRSEWKPEVTDEELLAMGDDAPTQVWEGDDQLIRSLERLERSLIADLAALDEAMTRLRAAQDGDLEK